MMRIFNRLTRRTNNNVQDANEEDPRTNRVF